MDDQKRSVLDDERIGRLLLKLSIPAFIGLLVATTYNVVDTIFVGQYVGPLGIAGLAIVSPIQTLSMAFGHMFGMGGASLISRSIGASDRQKAERALGNSITGVIMLSVILVIVGLSNTDFWLRLLGASDEILPYARDYMRIILYGIFFQTVALTLNSLIMSEGNARVAMTGQIIGAVSNIAFDAIFIAWLGWGVKGAAIGTVIAQLLCVTYYMRYFFFGGSFLRIYGRGLAIQWNILVPIVSVGISSFSTMVATSVSLIFMNRMLVAYGGDLAVSAYGIIHRLMMFSIIPGMSIGQGLQPILGFNYGDKRYDMSLRVIKIAQIAVTGFTTLIFLAFYIFPETFMGMFTTDSELVSLGVYASRRVFSTLYLTGSIIIGIFTFQAMGKAKQAFIITLRPLIFLLPLVLALPLLLQLDGVFLSYPITEALAFLLAWVLLIPQIRELKKQDILAKEELM